MKNNRIEKYLEKKGYEVVKANEKGRKLVYVPYKDHTAVYKYLRKYSTTDFSLRFNHNYETAIFYV